MAIHTTPNTKYVKGVRWLAELYEGRVIDNLTAQTLNKLVDLETSRVRMQLEEIERVMADYERQYDMKTAEFFEEFEAGQLGDAMDFVEWASLTKMAKHLHEVLEEISTEEQP
ncbi:MAG: hypothetical protein KPEEDBHJ_01445 [Anaerolineales bacterium]|nr:MAG: hypothetical protein EDM79_21260 [Chloroflexota bacterium]MBV6392223.1 hypothetical protein [Anaerolineales bacterium]